MTYFPLKNVVVSSTNKEWVTPKIKSLISKRQKAHFEGKLEIRDSLAKQIKIEVKNAKREFHESKIEFFENKNPKEWYRHINNIINNGKYTKTNLNTIRELARKRPSE